MYKREWKISTIPYDRKLVMIGEGLKHVYQFNSIKYTYWSALRISKNM